MDEKRDLLRHAVATVAYRSTRVISDAPEEFGSLEGYGRPPVKILAHMGDLFDWALGMAKGDESWNKSKALPWNEERQRFFASLAAFDAYLASSAPIHVELERLMQGPVADSLTHVGQLAMLRRLGGSPVQRENFYAASVQKGRVNEDQAPPEKPF
jgi:hypothetical protein